MNTSTAVQKRWNYCYGPGLGQSLARSPAREHAGARDVLDALARDGHVAFEGEKVTYHLPS